MSLNRRKLTKDQHAELASIKRKHGLLKPDDVINAAKKKTSALHSRFTWDIKDAAYEWWLQEARNIIQLHLTVLPGVEKPVRTFFALQKDRDAGGGYREITEILSDEDKYMQLLTACLEELRRLEQQYRMLKEMKPVWDARKKVSLAAEKRKEKKTTKIRAKKTLKRKVTKKKKR